MFIPLSKCYKPTFIFRNKTSVLYRYHSSNNGGRNWTARADFLTQSIRKQAVTRKDLDTEVSVSNIVDPAITLRSNTPVKKMFRGMIIPEKPKPPASDECCMSGCAICVYDIYITSLETYRDALNAIRTALQSQRVPISEWPDELVKKTKINNDNEIQRQDDGPGPDSDSELDVSLSAFAELEKSLRLKKKEEKTK